MSCYLSASLFRLLLHVILGWTITTWVMIQLGKPSQHVHCVLKPISVSMMNQKWKESTKGMIVRQCMCQGWSQDWKGIRGSRLKQTIQQWSWNFYPVIVSKMSANNLIGGFYNPSTTSDTSDKQPLLSSKHQNMGPTSLPRHAASIILLTIWTHNNY